MTKQIAIAFSAVFGVVPGYGHDNGLPEGTSADALVAHAWRESLEEEFKHSGILVGAAVTPGRVVYPSSFGCPADGEIVAVVTGNSNPNFVGEATKVDFAEFRGAVIRVARATKERLGQARVQLAFSEIDAFVYFEPPEDGGEQRWRHPGRVETFHPPYEGPSVEKETRTRQVTGRIPSALPKR